MFGFKKKVTAEDLGEFCYYFANRFSVSYASQHQKDEESSFHDVDEFTLLHERMILIFWIIDRFFGDKEKHIIAAMHKKHLSVLGILDKKDELKEEIDCIMSRYEEYYKAFNPEDGPNQQLLGGVVAKNILQQEKPLVDFLITSQISMDIMLIVKALKESIFDTYTLKK